MQFEALAQEYKTPLYVYDFDAIASQYSALKEAFKARKSLVCYALKANSNLSVVRHLAQMGAGCDCVSIGEVKRAFRAGVPAYKIIFSGVGKKDEEIKEALTLGILMLNLESEAEMHRVEMIARDLKVEARISIRVNPNIDPKTHPYISTGLHENKFGVEVDVAKRLYMYAKHSSHLDPVGIHFHIGSQITDIGPFKEATSVVAELVRNLKALEVDIKFFDIGGGLGVRYQDETPIAPYAYAQTIFAAMQQLDVTLVCEPGRFLLANSGYFLTRVLYEKTNEAKRFVIVDGGMNDLIRPSLYQAYHRVELVGKMGDESLADVVGPVCESGDFFAKNTLLPPTEHNDLLVIHSAGAYGFTMSSNYNSRPKAAEVACSGEKHWLIRPRESFEAMIALEEQCL
jgi:diaminopimelate decarboxylase